jgi:glycosyltransferase involved in cell wall biosynthesis
MFPKVSIVVPIYKVEKFISRCIDSIINQTYKDIEIILVDDGSPDNCGKIADDYAVEDNRIRVIHKQNGGLSDARNIGTAEAKGKYIFYLDSDDYLEPDTLSRMVDIAVYKNCDLVVANYYYTYDDHEDLYLSDTECMELFDNYNGLKQLVCGNIQNFAWGKLYRTDIVRKYLFPKGKLFEDTYWTHLVFAEAMRTAVIGYPAVHYVQRHGSISSEFKYSNLDILDGFNSRYNFLQWYYPKLCEDFLPIMAMTALELCWLSVSRKYGGEQKRMVRRLNDFLDLHYHEIQSSILISEESKKYISAFRRSISRYFMYELVHRIKRKVFRE